MNMNPATAGIRAGSDTRHSSGTRFIPQRTSLNERFTVTADVTAGGMHRYSDLAHPAGLSRVLRSARNNNHFVGAFHSSRNDRADEPGRHGSRVGSSRWDTTMPPHHHHQDCGGLTSAQRGRRRVPLFTDCLPQLFHNAPDRVSDRLKAHTRISKFLPRATIRQDRWQRGSEAISTTTFLANQHGRGAFADVKKTGAIFRE